MPKDYQPSKDVRELVSNPAFEKANRAKKLENRFLDKVDIFLCISEKEVAALAFPNLEGKLDYIGFKSNKDVVVDWTKALYNITGKKLLQKFLTNSPANEPSTKTLNHAPTFTQNG